MAKIAILHEFLGKSKGGIEAWIYNASEELLKQGHDITLFTIDDQVENDAAPKGVKVYKINRKKVIPSILYLRMVFNYKRILRNEINNYEIVWVRSFKMAWAVSKIFNKKIIYINAAPAAYYDYIPLKERIKLNPGFIGFLKAMYINTSLNIAYYLEKSAIRRCINVYLSNSRRDQTLNFFKIKYDASKFIVIPAGVNSERFFPIEKDWNELTSLKIISVSRLAKDKNIQCTIRAISHLIHEKYNVNLNIIGEGDYDNELKKLVNELNLNDFITFSGRQEKIEDWYRTCHVFVLPSLYEGFGSVYVEAMASGLPCIAISSNNGKYNVAVDDIIDHNLNGFLMKDNDPKELSEYIKLLFKSPSLLKEMSKNARNKAISEFNWTKTIHKLLEINTDLL